MIHHPANFMSVYQLMCRVNGLFFGGRTHRAQSTEIVSEIDVESHRNEIRDELQRCKEKLSHEFSERTVYRLLFAFTVFFDECILTSGTENHTKWRALQSELYETDEGGLLFYDTLDELLSEEHPSVVYEAFYFCLRLGFLGKLAGQPKRVASYMNALSERFSQPVEAVPQSTSATPKVFRLHSYQWYYAAALSCNLAFWAVIRFA